MKSKLYFYFLVIFIILSELLRQLAAAEIIFFNYYTFVKFAFDIVSIFILIYLTNRFFPHYLIDPNIKPYLFSWMLVLIIGFLRALFFSVEYFQFKFLFLGNMVYSAVFLFIFLGLNFN